VSVPEAAPYELLLELIERELQLAGEGRFDELTHAAEARAAHAASLPATPPAAAREALERAVLMQQRLTIEVLRGREAMVGALREIERAKRAANGYAPPRRRERLSASA
jgi:hypothetical protein